MKKAKYPILSNANASKIPKRDINLRGDTYFQQSAFEYRIIQN